VSQKAEKASEAIKASVRRALALRKIPINPELLPGFLVELGASIASTELSRLPLQELYINERLISEGILRGLILADYQPELATATKRMNEPLPYIYLTRHVCVEDLLTETLQCYASYIDKIDCR
jgi:hypothetical protein